MDNETGQELLVAGDLPKKCYTDVNELVRDMAKVLRLQTDTVAIIKGATGLPGKKGDAGSTGPAGPAGPAGSPVLKVINIPTGVKFVDFPYFVGYKSANYEIHHIGEIGSVTSGIPDYDPAVTGVVGCGIVIAKAIPSATTVRCYFVFAGGITVTPDANHRLHITYSVL